MFWGFDNTSQYQYANSVQNTLTTYVRELSKYQNIKILSKYQQLISTDKTKTTFKNETKATFKTNTECWVESLWLYKAHSPVQYKGAPTVQSSVPVQQCSQIPDYNQCFSLNSLISRTQLNIIRSHCTMYSQVHSKTT